MIRLAVADNFTMIIEGLVSLLADSTEIEVVLQAPDKATLVSFVQDNVVDVILLDIRFPKMEDGFEALKKVKAEDQSIKVMMMSAHDEIGPIKSCMAMGANGFLYKETNKAELINAIKTVHNGDRFLSGIIKDRVAELEIFDSQQIEPEKKLNLTDRQLEICGWIAASLSNVGLASKLDLSIETIQQQRKMILAKARKQLEKPELNMTALIAWMVKNKYI